LKKTGTALKPCRFFVSLGRKPKLDSVITSGFRAWDRGRRIRHGHSRHGRRIRHGRIRHDHRRGHHNRRDAPRGAWAATR